MLPLIIDHRLPGLGDSGPTLLATPLGEASLLSHILAWLGDEVSHTPIVLPAFVPSAEYERSIQAHAGQRVHVVHDLPAALAGLEPADRLLIVDARRAPLLDVDVAELGGRLAGYRGAAHVIAMGRGATDQSRERVACDERGRVHRVQRLLHAACWPAVANRDVVLSLVAAGFLDGLELKSTRDLRQTLANRGVLTRDEPLDLEVTDLGDPGGLLALNERLTLRALQRRGTAAFESHGGDVLIGRQCRIDPSARLIGPLILHDGVTVGPRVTLIGPGVVGRDCHIENDAIVAQAVLLPGSRVAAGAVASHRLVSGVCDGYAVGNEAGAAAGMRSAGLSASRAPVATQPSMTSAEPRRRLDLLLKRTLDIVCATLLLVVLGPLMVVVAVVVKLTSPGPVLFAHRRESARGREFPCLKFRTMVADAHRKQRELYNASEVDGPQFKMDSDPRVTRLGWVLRATNIDELPQLINVLLGHMSLVGPRPSPLRENQICIPWRRARLSVRPGITGLWQICRSADRSQGDFHEWIYYDINYVRHFSFWLDVKILAATVLTLCGRKSVPMAWVLRRAVGR